MIDALNGDPGVQSARFLRPDASYPERFAEIFRRLAARPSVLRTARFVAAVAMVRASTVIFETTATVEGEIALEARGDRGFGYDPIFYYPPYGSTLAEVTDDEKIAIAHRGRAFRKLARMAGKYRTENKGYVPPFHDPEAGRGRMTQSIRPGASGRARRPVSLTARKEGLAPTGLAGLAPQCADLVGPHERSITGSKQKLCVDQRPQQRIAGGPIKTP